MKATGKVPNPVTDPKERRDRKKENNGLTTCARSADTRLLLNVLRPHDLCPSLKTPPNLNMNCKDRVSPGQGDHAQVSVASSSSELTDRGPNVDWTPTMGTWPARARTWTGHPPRGRGLRGPERGLDTHHGDVARAGPNVDWTPTTGTWPARAQTWTGHPPRGRGLHGPGRGLDTHHGDVACAGPNVDWTPTTRTWPARAQTWTGHPPRGRGPRGPKRGLDTHHGDVACAGSTRAPHARGRELG
nr:ALK tyrosine kinase receptor-like [Microcebus murinus]